MDRNVRRIISFPCADETLIGTLDEAAGTTGVLIVSGGNEPRCGAHRGMAMLAVRLAAQGTPVFRYDRRGIGDSSGDNAGYEGTHDDLVAAAAAFRAHAPGVTRIVGFGNCDGAAALALFGRDAGIAAIVLANPWTGDQDDALPPSAAIRQRYAQRLRDPRAWQALLTGAIDFRRFVIGLRKIARTRSKPDAVAEKIVSAIRAWNGSASIVLAQGDATAIAFADAARRSRLETQTTRIPTASHSFARAGDAAALESAIRVAL